MKVHRTLALVLALGAAGVPLATALAKEPVSITIFGPGLAGEIEVTDVEDFAALANMGGEGVLESRLPPLGKAFYVIQIGIGDETGQVFATEVYHYYSDPAGANGYLKHITMDGYIEWFRTPASWDGAFRAVLQSHGVTLAAAPSAQVAMQSAPAVEAPVSIPVAPPAVSPLKGLVLAVIVTGVITALGAARMRVALRAHDATR